MKYYVFFFLTTFFLSTNVQAFQPKVEIIEQFDELKTVAFINAKDIDNTPKWNANLTPPPLTIDEAIQAVKKFIKSSNTLGAIKEIEIRPVPKHKNKWHYLIKTTNDLKKSKFDVYVVLMNGVVIPAIIEPQGYK